MNQVQTWITCNNFKDGECPRKGEEQMGILINDKSEATVSTDGNTPEEAKQLQDAVEIASRDVMNYKE